MVERVGREPVVTAGLKVLGNVGLEGLTLRAIAAELDVRAPSLYWRFRNKQDLVDAMAEKLLSDFGVALAADAGTSAWPEQTLARGRGLRAMLLRYRDGARMVAGANLGDATRDISLGASLVSFIAAEIPCGEALVALRTVDAYVLGAVLGEQAQPTTPTKDAANFDLGLHLLIAGFAASQPLGGKAWLDYRAYKATYDFR